MRRAMRLLPSLWTCLAIALALAGCASVGPAAREGNDLPTTRKARLEAAAAEFEKHRAAAELDAAAARWDQGDTAGAVAALQRLIRRSPRNVDARVMLAEILLSEDRADEAAEVLHPIVEQASPPAVEQASSLAPGDNGTSRTSGDARATGTGDTFAANVRAQSPAPPGKFQAGQAVPLRSAVRMPPDELSALATLVKVEGPGGSSGTVLPVAHVEPRGNSAKIVHAEPATPRGLIEIASEALAEGNREVARAYFHEAVSLNPHDPQIPVSAAVAALRHGASDLAVDLLEPAARRHPQSAAVHRALGAALYRRGDYRAAEASLRQALSLDKSQGLTYFLVGCTLAKLGQPGPAETHFRQARVLDPRLATRR